MCQLEYPEWLSVSAPPEGAVEAMKQTLDKSGLHTVCESADCPNIGECFAKRTCTFMILGDICTRNCRFCAVKHGAPGPINLDEPESVARTAKALGVKHVVVTTVTRDDLPDGGASQFVATIQAIRKILPKAVIEVLISDFKGQREPLAEILEAGPDIINHNVETVPRLYRDIRPQATFSRSLQVLEWVHGSGKQVLSKSGLMLGLGETFDEVVNVLQELRRVSCDMVTLGQYLAPSREHAPIAHFVSPDEFAKLEEIGMDMGFRAVSAGPLVRSSYNASHIYMEILNHTAQTGERDHGSC
ncbi:lipoyl synthase [Desulfoluna limicola]|uniref:Lipoyl synthase n=1 Tax=Desulfoluna limicola TaxID=2810562 RepID=A0ABM7PDP5_9BACT|nr:lipoyl synthase [Desulfoluna limicola]BCS95753.1 lipoyl synthase [Desulfoluna limicola]